MFSPRSAALPGDAGFEIAHDFVAPKPLDGASSPNPVFGLAAYIIEDYMPQRQGTPSLFARQESILSVSEPDGPCGSTSSSLSAEAAYEAERVGRSTRYSFRERFYGETSTTSVPKEQSSWAKYVLGRPHLALTPLVEIEPLEKAGESLVPLKREALSAFRTKWYTRAKQQFPYTKYGTAEILQIDTWLRREMALDTTIHPSTVASQASRIAAIAALPNRDDVAALRTWRSAEAQQVRRDARLAVKYSWWDRLCWRERPPAQS